MRSNHSKIYLLGLLLGLSSFRPLSSYSETRHQVVDIKNIDFADLNKLILSRIESQRSLILVRSEQINSIKEQLAFSKLDKRQKKVLQSQLLLNEKYKVLFEDKLNSYLFLLTEIQQTNFASNLDKNSMLLQIESLLAKVDKSKVDYEELKNKYKFSIFSNSAEKYIPKNDCILEKSKDGKVTANPFTPLFSFTPTDLEKHFGEDDFLKCQIRFLKSGSKYFCETRLEFNSSKASQYYGIIEESNPMKLIFLDGEFIYLQNAITSLPDIQSEKGKTIYRMQCPLNPSDLKKLKNKDLDQLIIVWPSGTEIYELFHLHTIQNLLQCLLRKN